MALTIEEAVAAINAGDGNSILITLARNQDDGRSGHMIALLQLFGSQFVGNDFESFSDRTTQFPYDPPGAPETYRQNFNYLDRDWTEVKVENMGAGQVQVFGQYLRWNAPFSMMLRLGPSKAYVGFADGIAGAGPALYVFSIQLVTTTIN